jgi:hypothetical protein
MSGEEWACGKYSIRTRCEKRLPRLTLEGKMLYTRSRLSICSTMSSQQLVALVCFAARAYLAALWMSPHDESVWSSGLQARG